MSQESSVSEDTAVAILDILARNLQHAADLQAQKRSLASKWIFAAFAGVGFAFSATEKIDIISDEMLIALAAFLGGIGIYILWRLDVLVYQRIWEANFAELRRLETKHAWLPSVGLRICELTRGKPRKLRENATIFYAAPLVALTAICVLALSALLARTTAPISPESTLLFIALPLSVFILVVLWRPHTISGEPSKNRRHAAIFYVAALTAIIVLVLTAVLVWKTPSIQSELVELILGVSFPMFGLIALWRILSITISYPFPLDSSEEEGSGPSGVSERPDDERQVQRTDL